MLSWHRRLIQLRRQISALTTGRLDAVEASCDEHSQWLRVQRGSIAIVCNFAKVAPIIRIDDRSLQPGPFYSRARKLYWDFAHA